MERVPIQFVVLRQSGRVWEYEFACPHCHQAVSVHLSIPPDALACPECAAPLDASHAEVDVAVASPLPDPAIGIPPDG